MSDKEQKVAATTTTGASVEISLEEWAKILIANALMLHKQECPLRELNSTQRKCIGGLDKRIDALELKLKILHWVVAPLYLAAVAWAINALTSLIKVVPAP